MDSSRRRYGIGVPSWRCLPNSSSEREESTIKTTTVGVDLAKNCFQLAQADERYRIVRRARFTRTRFAQWMSNHPSCLVVMEACGSAHYWARVLESQGHEVRLLPAQLG